jgi:hypothetical protein
MRSKMILKSFLIRKFQIASKTPWRMCIPFMSLHIQQQNKSFVTVIAEVSLRMSLLDVLSYLRLHIRCEWTSLVGMGA